MLHIFKYRYLHIHFGFTEVKVSYQNPCGKSKYQNIFCIDADCNDQRVMIQPSLVDCVQVMPENEEENRPFKISAIAQCPHAEFAPNFGNLARCPGCCYIVIRYLYVVLRCCVGIVYFHSELCENLQGPRFSSD